MARLFDRASIATLPPMMHPAGRPPTDWGPGRKIPYRRLGENHFADIPQFDQGSKEVEMIREPLGRISDLSANPVCAL